MLLIKKSITAIILTYGVIAFASPEPLLERTFEYRGKIYTYDDAMKMKEPPDGIIIVDDDSKCKARLEEMVPVSSNTFSLIHLAENGYSGMAKAWEGKDGKFTWDTGKYSINETNWPFFIKNGLNPFQLRWNDCASVIGAAYIMESLYIKANQQYKVDIINGVEPWEALRKMVYTLAGYNSYTPEVRQRYAQRLATMIGVMILKKDGKSFWKK